MLSNVWAFLFYYVLADTGLYAKGQSKSSASSSSDFGRRFGSFFRVVFSVSLHSFFLSWAVFCCLIACLSFFAWFSFG